MDTEIHGTDTDQSGRAARIGPPEPDWDALGLVARALGTHSPRASDALLKGFSAHRWGLRSTLKAILAGDVHVPGVGPGVRKQLQATLELIRVVAAKDLHQGPVLASSRLTKRFLCSQYAMEDREHFACLLLDSRHRLLRTDCLFVGTLDGAAVYPREVVTAALRAGAAAVIAVHNHPSGHPQPSLADHSITQRLAAALQLIDVTLLDHLIVGHGQCFSMAETGNMPRR